jgi:uncharacterized protein YndB with AHSA1/START domain
VARRVVLGEATRRTALTPDEVWARWADLDRRPEWHPGLAWARLDGPLAVGTTGAWKPERARPVRVRVAALDPGRRLLLEGTHGPAVARGHYEHLVAPAPGGGSDVTHRMWLTGPLAGPIGRLFGGALGVFATDAAVRSLAGAR